jgi:alpha-tubulin suppressor-like RCC1 family protein
MPPRFVPASVAVLLGIACPALYSQTWTISAPVNNSTLSITASGSHAGAITGLTFRNTQIVNNLDHGRQIQSAISFHELGEECYNPNEAGAYSDPPWSSSSVIVAPAPSTTGGLLKTTVNASYWYPFCAPGSNPSGFKIHKQVKISPPGFPTNVIDYLTQFTMAPNPPEPIYFSAAEAPVAYLQPLFTEIWTYDLATRNLLRNQETAGEDDMVKVLRSSDGGMAFSIYGPEYLQPYEAVNSFRWWIIPGDTSLLGTQNRQRYASPLPGWSTLSYRSYLIVGDTNEVKSSLNSLDVKFSSLDPDVFTWREYLRLHPDLPQTWDRPAAQSHWLSNGIAEGRVASYRFASVPYLQLNSDLAAAFGSNYQAAMDHYIANGRKEGRTTVPRADGGGQHTIVRSPQLDYVPVRASGMNYEGQLGNGNTTRTATPVQLPVFPGGHRVTDVAAGQYTSLAVLATGSVWMWGSNTYGARGNGTVGGPSQLTPVQVPNLPPIVVPSTKDRHVVAGGLSACAVVDNEGKVWTWGAGWNGQLGSGNTNARYTPGTVKKDSDGSDLTGIVSVSIGQSQMAALDIDGHVWTWGSNQSGALGINATGDRHRAVRVVMGDGSVLPGITQVVAGGSSFCLALARDGVLWAWGANGSGQLGNTTTTSSMAAGPVHIPWHQGSRNHIDKIAAGSSHALAHARSDGKIYVWGYNGWGQLGLPPGYPVNNPTPTALPVSDGTANITDVAAGSAFSLLIRANSTERKIFGMGDNQSGQLGLNHYMTQTQPALTSF